MQSFRTRRNRLGLIAVAAVSSFPSLGSAQNATWTFNGGSTAWTASWQFAGNWFPNSIPNSVTANVTFPASAVAGAAGTVQISAGAITASTLHFNSSGSNGYTLAGNGSLVLASSLTAGGTIDVAASSMGTISVPMSEPSGSYITKVGNGTLVLNGPGIFGGSGLQINAGVVRVAATGALTGLNVVATAGNGELELFNASSGGSLIFGAGSTPANGAIYSSAGNNTWNGDWYGVIAMPTMGVASGSTLTLNGGLNDGTDPSANGFAKVGGGVLNVHGVTVYGTLAINGGKVQILSGSSASTFGGLTVAGGSTPTATVDLTNNKLTVHNGDIAAIGADVAAGYNGGAWTGNGITSSTAAADAAAHGGVTNMAVGYAASGTDVIVAYTKIGDTNLDGTVDLATDFANLVNGLNNATPAALPTLPASLTNTATWSSGDFNFDGTVDVTHDFTAFANSYYAGGGSMPALQSAISSSSLPGSEQQQMQTIVQSIPEPATFGAIFVLAGMLPIRRRRKS